MIIQLQIRLQIALFFKLEHFKCIRETIKDYTDHSIVKIGENTQKIPEEICCHYDSCENPLKTSKKKKNRKE